MCTKNFEKGVNNVEVLQKKGGVRNPNPNPNSRNPLPNKILAKGFLLL